MMLRIKDAVDVARWRMCIGCGACLAACSANKLELVDFIDRGIRPVKRDESSCSNCRDCVEVCPGVGISHQPNGSKVPERPAGLEESWGPILEVWEGYATASKLRYAGSSGGLGSALSLFCIEKGGMSGVVHVGPDDVVRYRNKSQISSTRDDIERSTGSKYSPASPCDQLGVVREAPGNFVFMGKPCDIEGLRKFQSHLPELQEKVGVAIGIFCAGTPSTQGTIDLLRAKGVDPDSVEEIRYRGRGWPGMFAVRVKGECDWRDLATYEEAWAFLESYRPYRCHVCPDGTSEFADISCGDPWYRPIEPDEEGMSLILVRTEKGRRIVQGARDANYVSLKRVDEKVLDLSQAELRRKRGAIWGRLFAMKMLGMPHPEFGQFPLFRNWLELSIRDKARSLLGTARRIFSRGYLEPDNYHRRGDYVD